LFGQATYDLGGLSPALDGVKFTAGYRYTWDFRSTSGTSIDANPSGATAPTCGTVTGSISNGCISGASGQFHAPEWTVGLDYQIAPDLLIYATSRRGYKSGGFNITVPILADAKYAPEFVTDAEGGIKAEWNLGDIKLRTNADYFHYWYNNPQEQQLLLGAGGNVLQPTINGGAGQVDGFELGITAKLFDNLDLSGNYAYQYGTLSTVPVSEQAGGGFAHDVQFGGLPKNKFSLTGTYHVPIPDGLGALSFTANWNYQSNYWTSQNADREPGSNIAAYGIVNLNADWNGIGNSPFDVSVFVNNLLDRAYEIGDFSVYKLIGYNAAIYAEPRMYGVKVRFRWGPDSPGLSDLFGS
jgi:iron complex outermembrane recepter protein